MITKRTRAKLDIPKELLFGLDVPDLTGYTLEQDHPFYQIVTPYGNIPCRHCAQCNRIRTMLEFYAKKIICKECHRFKVRKWQKKNADKVRSYKKTYNRKYNARIAYARNCRKSRSASTTPLIDPTWLPSTVRPISQVQTHN